MYNWLPTSLLKYQFIGLSSHQIMC